MLDLFEVSIWPWIIANGVVAIWALLAHVEERLRHRSLWYAVGVAQAVIAAHVVFAVAAQAQDSIEPGEPLLYGLVAFMSCGMIFSYRSYMQDRPYLSLIHI